MLKLVLLLLTFFIISLLDLPSIIKKKDKRQLIVYSAILGSALLLSGLHAFRIPIPSPDRLITDAVHLFIKM